MGYTVLKLNKRIKNRVEVAGEFLTEEEANQFAEDGRRHDLSNGYEFIVEKPPSQIETPRTVNFAAIQRNSRTGN